MHIFRGMLDKITLIILIIFLFCILYCSVDGNGLGVKNDSLITTNDFIIIALIITINDDIYSSILPPIL